MLSDALLALILATSMAAPKDDVMRDILDLVERTHLHQQAEPATILRAAAESLARSSKQVRVGERDGALVVTVGGRSMPLEPSEGTTLAERVGPTLERLLALASEGRDERGRQEARAALLDGMLRSIDRWSSASTGRRRADQQVRRTGELGGVGVKIGRRDGRIRVLSVFEDSGAAAAGLRAGEELHAVASHETRGMSVSDALALLRGPAGTSVDVVAGEPPRSLGVERRALRQPSVGRRLLPGGVAMIRIGHVSLASAKEVREALDTFTREAPLRGIILDLRGNTGGSMIGAASIADLFLSEGVIAEALDGRDQPVEGLRPRIEATPGGDLATPLALLADAQTASSAELLAAALVWHGRARLAGETTFGKVVVGKPHAFPDADLTVTITSALMRAAGRRLPDTGLVPDWPIDPRDPRALETLAARLVGGE